MAGMTLKTAPPARAVQSHSISFSFRRQPTNLTQLCSFVRRMARHWYPAPFFIAVSLPFLSLTSTWFRYFSALKLCAHCVMVAVCAVKPSHTRPYSGGGVEWRWSVIAKCCQGCGKPLQFWHSSVWMLPTVRVQYSIDGNMKKSLSRCSYLNIG